MSRETPMFYADQMQFIVAAMTKDYEKARGIANAILEVEPGNTIFRNYLSILETDKIKRNEIRDDVSISESDSEPASVDSDSDDTDSKSNSDNDSDTEGDVSSQDTEDIKKERGLIEPKKNSQRFETKELLFDSGKARLSHDKIYRHNLSEINQSKFRYNYEPIKGKMIRVLPISLNEKIIRRLNNKIND